MEDKGGSPVTAVVEADEAGDALEDANDRYNEDETPSKRRRLSPEPDEAAFLAEAHGTNGTSAAPSRQSLVSQSRKPSTAKAGPFMEDSDSEEDEVEKPEAVIGIGAEAEDSPSTPLAASEAAEAATAQWW